MQARFQGATRRSDAAIGAIEVEKETNKMSKTYD